MKLSAEILILAMLVLSNGRVLTIRKPHLDPLVMLAPLSLLLASLSLFSFSVDLFLISILLISILVLLSNFHALIRYSSHLVIDRYSPLMKFWAWLTTILSVAVLISVIIFSPVRFPEKKHDVNITTENYTGSFAKGFVPSEKFEISNGFITEFSPKATAGNPAEVVLFFSDKRGDTEHYRPYLVTLAEEGFTVVSGDFYSKDLKWIHTFEDSRLLRRMGLAIRSVLNNRKYKSQREFYTFNFSREIETMTSLMKTKYGKDCRFFIVTDEMGFTAAQDFSNSKPDLISGIFNISTVPEYITPGYGFIQQTDPLLGKFLNVKRDRSFEAVKACVRATAVAVKGE